MLTTSTTGKVMSAVLDDPRVRKLSFTGSTVVGRILLRKAADQVIHSSMELGGNAPFLVFEDAALDAALDGLMIAKMRNGGEARTAAIRIYVHRSTVDDFAACLPNRMLVLRVGTGADETPDCGPLINAGAVSKVAELVDDAVSRGARILCGGKPGKGAGHFYPSTVVEGVCDDSAIRAEEIFGPVAPLYVFDTKAEAIERANDTEYGLVAYLYTRDLSRGLRVSEALEAGMIALNRGLVSDLAAPFGGVKQSGLGREGARHGMLEFLEAKCISTDW